MFGRSSRGLLDFVAAALCLWAAAYHTPVGALFRSLVARVTNSHSNARPMLAYYSGGVYDTQDVDARSLPTDVPDPALLATIPPGAALGRGVYATVVREGGEVRKSADDLAAHYQVAAVDTPNAAEALVDKARAEFVTDDAAVLAIFAGYEVARYAVVRARAEGREPTLTALLNRLPPTSTPAVERASTALMLGKAYALSWPVAPGTPVTSPFGWRNHPLLHRQQLHTGVDLSVPQGTPVKATAAGTVRRASEDDVNGRVVIIDHGYGVSTAYCHNSALRVLTGQHVEAGDVIADSGSTGRSTGPHVHYQLELGGRPTNPFAFRGSKALAQLPELPVKRPPPGGSPALTDAFKRAGAAPDGVPMDGVGP